jgi:hypothetical protein
MIKEANNRAATMQPAITPTRTTVLDVCDVLFAMSEVEIIVEEVEEEVEVAVEEASVVEAAIVGTVLARTAARRAKPSYG